MLENGQNFEKKLIIYELFIKVHLNWIKKFFLT